MRANNRPCPPVIPTTASRRVVQPPVISRAARSQAAGLSRLAALSKSLSGSDLDSAPPASTPRELSDAEKAEAERLAEIEDQRVVEEELTQYEAEGLMDDRNPEFADFDLLRYWQVICSSLSPIARFSHIYFSAQGVYLPDAFPCGPRCPTRSGLCCSM